MREFAAKRCVCRWTI